MGCLKTVLTSREFVIPKANCDIAGLSQRTSGVLQLKVGVLCKQEGITFTSFLSLDIEDIFMASMRKCIVFVTEYTDFLLYPKFAVRI